MDHDASTPQEGGGDRGILKLQKRGLLRTIAMMAIAAIALAFIVGVVEINHYKPLEIGGFSGTTSNDHVVEPRGTFVIKYVVTIGNRGPFPVQLTEVLPVRMGLTSQATTVTKAFLPTSNVYGEHHRFHSVTIAPGRYVDVGIRINVRCFPLIGGNSQAITSQSFVFRFLGLSETQTLNYANIYPAIIFGPQNCKVKD